jgi:DNA invertase Pin-like site-specific DNA recombinase
LPNGKQNPAASLIFLIYAEIARMETDALSERNMSGLDEAKRQGIKLGRKVGSIIDEKELEKSILNHWQIYVLV